MRSSRQINRLVTFQRRCLHSEMSNTHPLNKWMVKFLLQHALALDDKEEEEDLSHQWLRPHESSESPISRIHGDLGLIERSRVAEGIIQDMRMRYG
jgi:hypothetical protein